MRLHHLRITAFGPFADTVEVDFDELGADGLFLLCGATGAGKSSVLDAICFALYGDIPGDRAPARRLRSDHARPGVNPEVVLEATLAGRRLRFVRSPAWQRPKKKGTGTTHQQASVRLLESRAGVWDPVSHRLDEVGDQVAALLGMNLAQFCQVAMLPQGRFQAFLRAKADERQAVLQQLFGTGRFTRMESWLRDHRLALHRTSRVHHDTVAGLVNRMCEAAGQQSPADWDLRALEAVADTGDLASWAEQLGAEAGAQADRAQSALPQAQQQELDARRRVDSGRALSQLQDQHRLAGVQWAALEATAPEQRHRQAELAAARRAATLAPLIRLTEQAAGDTEARQARSAEALQALGTELTLADLGSVLARDLPVRPSSKTAATNPHAALVEWAEQVQQLLDERTAAWAPLAGTDQRIEQVAAAQAAAATSLATTTGQLAETSAALAAAPERVAGLRLEHASALAAATTLERLEQDAGQLESRILSGQRAEELAAELSRVETERQDIRADVQARTQTWLDLREARLHGMAAEIAGSLIVGGSCPVCGSCSHPAPAQTMPGAPQAEDERSALRQVDDAKAVLQVHDDRVHQVRQQLEAARIAAGQEALGALRLRLSTVRTERDQAAAAAARVQELAAELFELERLTEALQLRESEQRVLLATQEEQRRAADRELAELVALRDSALTDSGHADLESLLEQVRTLSGLVVAFVEHARAAAQAQDHLEQQEAALRESLSEQGFPDAQAARAAYRGREQCQRLEQRIQRHLSEEARLGELLRDPELVAAAEATPPDLEALESDHRRSAHELTHLQVLADRAGACATRLVALNGELLDSLRRWEPLREELTVVTDLSAFVEGKSADNRLQMRLAAYVLGYRLSQVVAAANARLSAMSDQRYCLEHTGQRGARETRGGLSLLVRDAWTGQTRDPVTLSGGETFVVSLALALGLADVITQEAGGADLDTLFVDEGFGSLDTDTLDDVLDTLDNLRTGGRVVGVVSHVTEIRERIPTQLHVDKGREGSHLRAITVR